jgi:glycosyltransferase involved in cell wall biosynthesis
MTTEPDVTVVVPTKDRWGLLSRMALPSALAQQDVRFEVVVVDDGSSDGTERSLRALAAEEQRLRVVRHERPRGVAAARNAGLAAARGTWVAFLDDDDVWSPRKLRAQVDAVGDEDVFAYAGAVAFDENGDVLYPYYFPDPSELREQLLRWAVVPAGASNVLARADVVRELGGFDERLFHLEDWDLWLRLADAGHAVAVPDVLVGVLFHPANKHAVNDQSHEVEYLIEKHAQATPPRRLRVDRLGHARWVASQHSRAGLHRRAAWLYLRGALAYRSPGNVARAADALLGKRLSRLTRRRPEPGRVSPPAPEWLHAV